MLGGTVAFKSGRPVPAAPVTLRRAATDPISGVVREFLETTRTDAQGRFVFGNIPAGPVDLLSAGARSSARTCPPKDAGEFDLVVP